jgi:hypothetical protein
MGAIQVPVAKVRGKEADSQRVGATGSIEYDSSQID